MDRVKILKIKNYSTINQKGATNKNIFLFDKGKSVRTWGYIADITAMILNVVQFGKSSIYNVSGSDHKSIIQIAKIISKCFNNKKIIIKNKD